jgi:hypothetical protein
LWDYDQWFKILFGYVNIPYPGCTTYIMVYCRVTYPYPSSTHLTEGDESRKCFGNCNVPRGYPRGRREVDRIATCVVTTGQSNYAIAIYSKGKSHA